MLVVVVVADKLLEHKNGAKRASVWECELWALWLSKKLTMKALKKQQIKTKANEKLKQGSRQQGDGDVILVDSAARCMKNVVSKYLNS